MMEMEASQAFNKNILIVNACNKLGGAIAQCFLLRGAKLIVPSGNITALKEIKSTCQVAKTGQLIPFLADMSDYDRTLDIAQVIADEYGLPDIIIAIFKLHAPKPVLNSNPENGLEEADSDEWSFIPGAKAFLQLMKNNDGHRALMNICTAGTDVSNHYLTLSPSMKANFLHQTMAKEFFTDLKNAGIKYYYIVIEGEWQDNHSMICDYLIGLYNGANKETAPTIHHLNKGDWELIGLE